jgi:hypothetical protein
MAPRHDAPIERTGRLTGRRTTAPLATSRGDRVTTTGVGIVGATSEFVTPSAGTVRLADAGALGVGANRLRRVSEPSTGGIFRGGHLLAQGASSWASISEYQRASIVMCVLRRIR